MATTFLDRHRGPYRLVVDRESIPKKSHHIGTSQWLSGDTNRDDVESEALALLADPRDTIRSVHVWSVREEQFIGAYTQKDRKDGSA